MNKRLKFIEVNYHQHDEFSSPGEVIKKHGPSNLFFPHFLKYADIILVKHLDLESELQQEGLKYVFFKRKNSFFQIPGRSHRFIAGARPDIILVQGFIFPLQVYFLRKILGKKCRILVQHHGELPFKRKRPFQKLMSRVVDGWLFASLENAGEWIKSGIIREGDHCFAIPPASTSFTGMDKEQSRKEKGMKHTMNFLWVGRLNRNKDPFTVLEAFEKYLEAGHHAGLYMIYTEPELEAMVKKRIRDSALLQGHVELVGPVQHDKMESWYSAADYYISSSHREGGSYALVEAMACGCVPVVSRIPASMQMINGGEVGYSFPPGDVMELFRVLHSLDPVERETFSRKAREYFDHEMSPAAIADKMYTICRIIS